MLLMPQPLTWDTPGLTWDMPGLFWDGQAPNSNPTQLTMASDNRISLDITTEQKAAIQSAVNALKTALDGLLTSLTPEEKQSLPRIGDNTLAFDEKCAAYMTSRADLVPSFLDTAEMAKDRKLVADLLPFFRELSPLCSGLEDTIMLANSDNLVGDLAFYQNVKQAAKRGIQGAGTIYDDLKTRFPGRPKKDTPTPPAS
jgi:hypothetical protein